MKQVASTAGIVAVCVPWRSNSHDQRLNETSHGLPHWASFGVPAQ